MEKDLYEGHIAIPNLPLELTNGILAELKSIGITDYDYFLKLMNLPPDGQPCNIDPATHDIDDPMLLTTTRFKNRDLAISTIKAGMDVLKAHGIKGVNFEIEAFVDGIKDSTDSPHISDFPGFTQQEGGPLYEGHIIWEGVGLDLPPTDEIIRYHRDLLGYPPNQIAEFGLTPAPALQDTIWRVSTVYYETREAVLKFAESTGKNLQLLGHAKSVFAEKICVVTNPQ